LFEEEVESLHILGLGSAAFGGSSSFEEYCVKKTVEGDISSGHKKAKEEPKEQNVTLGIDTAEATQTTGKEIDELWFFMRHIGGSELSDKVDLELENKGEAMGYGPRAMLFGEKDQMLMCVPDFDESKIIGNITRSIDFPKVEDKLIQVKSKLSHSLAYTSIKVQRSFILM
jgi:hypothetical protein